MSAQNSFKTRTVCVTSGKGGVGKTTLSINLSLAMLAAGYKVVILDGDLGLANINIQMGITPEYNILDVIKGQKTLAEIVCKTKYGVDFIAGGTGIPQLANLDKVNQSAFMSSMETLIGYDIMIIDTAAGISANVIRFAQAADQIVVVTTPEPTAMTDAYGIIKTITLNKEHPPIQILVNRVTSEKQAKEVVERINKVTDRFLGLKFDILGYVPVDPLVEKSIFLQRPHLICHPKTKSAALIHAAANHLLDPDYQEEPAAGLAGFFQKVIKFSSER
ncbi:flagellar biosynthesis protein FlhG [Gammaproteobacteria bacterium]